MPDDQYKYKVVSLLDVNELLPFAKEEVRSLEQDIKEEKRVEKELKEFIGKIEKHSGHKIHYIGHEKRYGKHLVRFLLQKGGFIEVMVEKPLALNAHFIKKESAEKFANGLKKALDEHLPDHPVKQMFIDSIAVEDGFKDDVITVDKWSKIHKLAIHKTLLYTIVVFSIFIIIEIIKEFFLAKTKEVLPFESVIVTLITAVIIVLFYEQIKEKIELWLAKILKI